MENDPAALFECAANGDIDIVMDATAGDLELSDSYSDLGWVILECGCIIRIGGPFDPHSHTE